jgi:hypothetical protein
MLGNPDSSPVIRSFGGNGSNAENIAYASTTDLKPIKEFTATDVNIFNSLKADATGKKYGLLVSEGPSGPVTLLLDLGTKDINKKYTFIKGGVHLKNPENPRESTSIDVQGRGGGYFISKYKATGIQINEKKDGKFVPVKTADPGDYEWNLPPHAWSLPYFATSDPQSTPSGFVGVPSDKYRRGRIWWKQSDNTLKMVTFNGEGEDVESTISNENRQYGFQFLWNPETFNTSVAVQMDATPNAADRLLGMVGAFPATQQITFVVRLDRTNDFACAANLFKRPTAESANYYDSTNSGKQSLDYIQISEVDKFIKYYLKSSFGVGSGASSGNKNSAARKSIQEKLVDLFQRGTVADVEYLYKAINGSGPGEGSFWRNPRGTYTADIGFLQPTLLNIDIGPLSYQGYVTNMAVTHIGFTPNMTPIRTDLSISLNVLATAGVTSDWAKAQAEEED